MPKRNDIKKKYFIELNAVLDKHRTQTAIKTIITKNVGEWFTNQKYVNAQSIALDATPTLIKATKEQELIGWDNWIKGRWSSEWATLMNYNISSIDSGIKFNTSLKWAKEIILLTWNFIHEVWLERNKCEHDTDGDPEKRKKEKLAETIQGESELLKYSVYAKSEVGLEILLNMPTNNLVMLVYNLKNAKESKRNEKLNMLPE
jgi:uncharacterized protein YejL (UPF0352 family)